MIICTGMLPWIVLDLLQWKTQYLFTYIRSGFVNHYFPVESQQFNLNRQNWKSSVKKLNITIMFPFYNLFKKRFMITLAKGVFDLQIDKKKKPQICLKWIKIVKKKQQHIVKIFYMWMLCITLKERNTKRFVQNSHSRKSPSTEWSWFLIELVMFLYFLCS